MKVLEYIGGKMEVNIKGIGRLEIDMDKECLLIEMESYQSVTGKGKLIKLI